MVLKRFNKDCEAEALDEDGVRCCCMVIHHEEFAVTVNFNGWKSEWDRMIDDPSQIRPRTDVASGKRKRLTLSSKVRICRLVLMAVSNINEMKSDGWFPLDHCWRSPALVLFLGFLML